MLRLFNQLISLKLLILPVFDGQIFYLSEEWKRQITIPLFARLMTIIVNFGPPLLFSQYCKTRG